MADWNDLKKAFEREFKKEEDLFVENEQKLLKSITSHICSQKGVSSIQGYKPEEIIAFLEKPVFEIRTCLSNEWDSVSDDRLENLIYSLSKKVKKSDHMLFG